MFLAYERPGMLTAHGISPVYIWVKAGTTTAISIEEEEEKEEAEEKKNKLNGGTRPYNDIIVQISSAYTPNIII